MTAALVAGLAGRAVNAELAARSGAALAQRNLGRVGFGDDLDRWFPTGADACAAITGKQAQDARIAIGIAAATCR